MLSQAEAIIFLASQRGCSQTEQYRSYHTLNFGTHFKEDRRPFGRLLALNEETLGGGVARKYRADEDIAILILPVVGTPIIKSNSDIQHVEAGQSHVLFIGAGEEFEIYNPYLTELINYLHIWVKIEPQSQASFTHEFNLQKQQNQLLSILPKGTFKLGAIGQFDARREGTYTAVKPDSVTLVFVIEGVFEVENRLLQPRDALALWNVSSVEFEALSKDAIILILE